jgi:hypothetical protein
MYKHIIFLFVLVGLFSKCARVGRPTGGDKDLKPPITISASPDFETVNFKSDRIKIYFDEYIKFKDLNKQLIVSPPLNYPLEITPLGTASKFISIKIKDTLKENTTYTINFGNAIVDNSEGNVLKQFKYVFSTGSYLDSLQISGSVKDAFSKEIPKDISVLLYAIDSSFTDSIIYKRKPDYITNTVDTTAFSITNIKEGNYLLLALKDASKNMQYDAKEDQIAYLKAPVTLPSDSSYQLILFKEKPEFAVKKIVEVSMNHKLLAFEGDLGKNKVVEVLDKEKNPVSFFSYKDRQSDSLHIWHKDIKTDSLIVRLMVKDSINTLFVKQRSKDRDSLQIIKSSRQILPLRDSLFIISNIPIKTINAAYINFIDKDSVKIPFTIVENPLKDKFQIAFDKKYNTNYSLTLLPKAVTDFIGQQNDTLKISFNTKKPEDYGGIDLKLVLQNKSPVIVELVTDKGVLVSRRYITESQTLKYPLLVPAKYTFRVIIDDNRNKKWDSGNFLKKIQPEKVFYYSKEIEVRANWSITEEFIVK